jgi:cytochrome c5
MTTTIRLAKHACIAMACAATLFLPASARDRTGREVVEKTCSACHAEGKDGAPKTGDFGAWAQRAQGGFGKLSEHANSGKNKMPAHGGDSKLTDLEITRAIAYMSTGGLAADPDKPYAQTKTVEGDVLVKTHCVKCHGTGVDGAPRLHEFSDWKPRVGKGLDALVSAAVDGHNKMPSRAGLPGLSDFDLRNAVTYMIVQSAGAKSKPAN